MGIVRSNNISVKIAPEATVGTIPSSGISLLEPNAVPDFGAELTLVPRLPISKNRQERQGDVVDLNSKLSLEMDLTMHHLRLLAPTAYFCEATAVGGASGEGANGEPYRPSAVTTTDYTVASGGALAQHTLIRARGFAVSGNNGVKAVAAASGATAIKASGLATEVSAPLGATVEVCGYEFTSGDLAVASASTLTTATKNMTQLGLTPGQWVHVGDADTGSGYGFATAADYGLIRVLSVAANLLTFDKALTSWTADTGTGKTVRMLFGPFIRNVDVDDAAFKAWSWSAEIEYPNLNAPDPGWQYSVGNYLDQIQIQLPLANKATMRVDFVGTDTNEMVSSESSGWSTPYPPTMTVALNSTSRVKRLRVANGSTAITSYFKGMTVTVKNNVSPEKVIAQLGALDMNYGFFQVSIDSQVVLTDPAIVSAVRDNTTLTFDVGMRNADGGFVLDIPSMYLGSAKPSAPVNAAVLTAVQGRAFQDATFGFSSSISLFPYLPAN